MVFTNAAEFINRMKAAAWREGLALEAGPVGYIDPKTHHGYWPITRRRIDPIQLDAELGPLTVPDTPLPTMLATFAPKSEHP